MERYILQIDAHVRVLSHVFVVSPVRSSAQRSQQMRHIYLSHSLASIKPCIVIHTRTHTIFPKHEIHKYTEFVSSVE